MSRKDDYDAEVNIARIPDKDRELLDIQPLLRAMAVRHPRAAEMAIAARMREVAPRVAALTACGTGCSHCCHQAVAVSEAEAEAISAYTGVVPATPAILSEDDTDILQEYALTTREKYYGTPCVFLSKDGRCTIYEVRPVACATHFNMSNNSSLCVTTPESKRRQDVPCLNMQHVWMAQSMLAYAGRYGIADIREFFPEAVRAE